MTKRPKNAPNNALMMLNSEYASIALCLALISLLFACASTPPSTTLPQSKVAVSSIDHNNYRKYLNDDVTAAKNKLKKAHVFAAEKQHIEAEQLAQQILVDVELIQIRTQRMNVDQEVKQIEDSISNLNEELKWREPVQLSPLK